MTRTACPTGKAAGSAGGLSLSLINARADELHLRRRDLQRRARVAATVFALDDAAGSLSRQRSKFSGLSFGVTEQAITQDKTGNVSEAVVCSKIKVSERYGLVEQCLEKAGAGSSNPSLPYHFLPGNKFQQG